MYTVVANNKSNYVQVVELNPSAKGRACMRYLLMYVTVYARPGGNRRVVILTNK